MQVNFNQCKFSIIFDCFQMCCLSHLFVLQILSFHVQIIFVVVYIFMGKHILNGRVVIPLLHANPFIITQKIHKFDQVISKVKSDILNKISPKLV